MENEFRGQILAAAIGAGMALAIAIGGFLYQHGEVTGHLDNLDYREKRIEAKVDLVYQEVVDLRERTARIEARLGTTAERLPSMDLTPRPPAY